MKPHKRMEKISETVRRTRLLVTNATDFWVFERGENAREKGRR